MSSWVYAPRHDGGKVECSLQSETEGSLLSKIAIKQAQWKTCFLIAERERLRVGDRRSGMQFIEK